MTNEQAGLATKLVGLVEARELLDREIQKVRAQLDFAHNGGNARTFVEGRALTLDIGKSKEPKKNDGRGKAARGYWARMTAEERAAEMQRRILVHQGKAPSSRAAGDVNSLHPRDARSPRHAAWVKKMRKANLERWASYTPEERAARVASSIAKARRGAAA